jgi:hypothetical protein
MMRPATPRRELWQAEICISCHSDTIAPKGNETSYAPADRRLSLADVSVGSFADRSDSEADLGFRRLASQLWAFSDNEAPTIVGACSGIASTGIFWYLPFTAGPLYGCMSNRQEKPRLICYLGRMQ